MSWLKRFRGKRHKSNKDSLDEARAQPAPTPTSPVLIDLQGKKPARSTTSATALGSEQVCVLTTSDERTVKLQLTFRMLALVRVLYLQILTLPKACSVSIHLFTTCGSKLK
jgi:hypothetical protein